MEIITLSTGNFKKAVQKAVTALRKGKLVLYPTDTLYGLAADIANPAALQCLRELKGREKKKPLSVVVPSVESISQYAVLNETARVLGAHFLPGPLTLVLPALPTIPEECTLNGTIGIRIPNDPFSLALAAALGRPFTATSANKSGRETPFSVQEVIEQFGHAANNIELAIDAGERRSEQASTVVSFADGVPQILREGAISKEDILIGTN